MGYWLPAKRTAQVDRRLLAARPQEAPEPMLALPAHNEIDDHDRCLQGHVLPPAAFCATTHRPHDLTLEDLDAGLIGAFLNHLEAERGASVRTRNARLTAIRSLFNFAAYRHAEHAGLIQRVLAIPPKRANKALVTYLDEKEMDALLAAPDRSTWRGRRDHALLLVGLETGLRASELTGLTCGSVQLGTGAHVRCTGKGRKERATPLRREARQVLRAWLEERGGRPDEPLFPGPRGEHLSRDAVRRLVVRHVATATGNCPSLAAK